MKALVLTVGMGSDKQLETAVQPLLDSARHGAFSLIVLLSSKETRSVADAVEAQLRSGPEVWHRQLKNPGDHDNADKCFQCFQAVFGELRERGVPPGDITVDFTKGTKGMSAALVLAATMNDVPHWRYTGGEREPGRQHNVKPGTGALKEFDAREAMAEKTLALARGIMDQGHFSAARKLFHSVGKQSLEDVAAYYEAWDNLDYGRASRVAQQNLSGVWKRYQPSARHRAWSTALSVEPASDDWQQRARHTWDLAVDLCANAGRRLRQGQIEDALLRCYRVLELAGQAALFGHNLDSGGLDPADAKVVGFNAELVKKFQKDKQKQERRRPMVLNAKGRFEAPREKVAEFLRYLKDPWGDWLLGGWDVFMRRNRSLLIHGFKAQATDLDLGKTLPQLEALLKAKKGNLGWLKGALDFRGEVNDTDTI